MKKLLTILIILGLTAPMLSLGADKDKLPDGRHLNRCVWKELSYTDQEIDQIIKDYPSKEKRDANFQEFSIRVLRAFRTFGIDFLEKIDKKCGSALAKDAKDLVLQGAL